MGLWGEQLPAAAAFALSLGGAGCALGAAAWFDARQIPAEVKTVSARSAVRIEAPVSAPAEKPASVAPLSSAPNAPVSAVTSGGSHDAQDVSPDRQVEAKRAARVTDNAVVAAPSTTAPASEPAPKATAAPSVASAPPVAPPSARQNPSLAAPGVGNACRLGVIAFPHGYKAPAFERRALLDTLHAWLVEDDERRVLLRGHADAGGTDGFNLRLSAARARWVRNWLTKKGIQRRRITVQALGEYLPLVDAEPDSARHRRVEVFGLNGVCPRKGAH